MERGFLRDRIAERRPLTGSLGESGAPVEKGILDDGTPVVIKQIRRYADIGMQATNDSGRAVTLFTHGVLDRLPAGVRDVTLDAWHEESGCVLVMSDVSAGLISNDRRVSGAECKRIVDALAAVHHTYRGEPIPQACPAVVRMSMFSPKTLERLTIRPEFHDWIVDGWSAFHDLVDADVLAEVEAVQADMAPLAAQLAADDGNTLLHGDTWLQNLALVGDDVVLLDWALATWGPPALEYAYFLGLNGWQIDLSHEEILDLCRAAEGPAMSERSLRLSLFWGLASYGWNKAWHAAHNDDEGVRAREAADLDWWVAAARTGIELWSVTRR